MAGFLRALLTVFGTALVLLCVLTAAPGQAVASPAGPRLALVVGNAAYRSGTLPTAANDAGLVAQALAQDGFAVTALADADAATLRKAFGAFADEIKQAGDRTLVVVYMAGAGVQYGGRNYVVPAGAAIERQADIPEKAVAFSELLEVVEPVPARARFFVYDLAYPTPLATSGPIPLAAGLRHMEPSSGSLYAFNAAPGAVAPEGVPPYGLYARAWAEALRTPGLGIHSLFSRIRLRVAEITSSTVVPWDNGEVDPLITFAPSADRPREVANRPLAGLPVETVFWAALTEDTLAGYQAFLNAFPKDPLADRIRAMRAVRLEAANWAEACRADTAAAYWTFMRRYPRGPHYVDVRRRLEAIHAALEPPMRFEVADLGGLPTPSAEEGHALDRPQAAVAAPTMIPSPPDGLLPAAPSEFGVDLAPPPLVPRGALPVSFPVVPTSAKGQPGPVVQPYVPELGRLTITTGATESGGTVMALASEDGPLTRTTATYEGHLRSLSQRDAAEEVVSQTIAKRAGDTLTIAQSGPDGNIVIKVVTRFSLNGDRHTRVSNGAGQLVAEVEADKRNVVKSVKRGPASIDDASIALVPSAGQSTQGRTPGPPKATGRDPRGGEGEAAAAPESGKRTPVESRQVEPKSPTAVAPGPAVPGSARAPLPPKSALRIRPAEAAPEVPETTRPGADTAPPPPQSTAPRGANPPR